MPAFVARVSPPAQAVPEHGAGVDTRAKMVGYVVFLIWNVETRAGDRRYSICNLV